MSNFLDDLKKSVETGEFNSDIANKFNDIDKKADEYLAGKNTEDIGNDIEDRKNNAEGVEKIPEEELGKIKSEYEEKMKKYAKEEKILAVIATLTNIDEKIDEKVFELSDFINNIEVTFKSDDPDCKVMFNKVEEIKSKYKFNNE